MNPPASVYIHIPFCKSKCRYCDFFSMAGRESLLEQYVDALCSEISFYAEKYRFPAVKTLYIGGGTPSLLPPLLLEKILRRVSDCFAVDSESFEGTVELNPDDVTEEYSGFLKNTVLNRISLGIQSLNENTLSAMNRRSPRKTCLSALRCIGKHFPDRFSVDLIAGFPGETKEELCGTVREVLSFCPAHVSLYSLCVEQNTPLYGLIHSGSLPFSADYSDECWLSAKTVLEENGFLQYEVSNFARDRSAFCRHNLTYWHLESYLGFGSGVTSSLYAEGGNSFRYTNTRDIDRYISFWKNADLTALLKKNGSADGAGLFGAVPADFEEISAETEEFEYFMMNFRLTEGVSQKRYEARFGKSLSERLGAESGTFSKWVKNGCAAAADGGDGVFYRLTRKGILFLNSFLEEL